MYASQDGNVACVGATCGIKRGEDKGRVVKEALRAQVLLG